MSNKPLVSIITPTYNQGEFIAETIKSILNQDYPNIEYRVIDDGSTDNTSNVLRDFGSKIKWERQENIGQVRTLNKGWSKANGKYFGYLSSDDTLKSNAVSKLVSILEENESIVCAFPNSDLIDTRSRVIKKAVCRPFNLTDLVVMQQCYIGPGAIFRRDTYKLAGPWNPELKLGPDREFWIRLAAFGNINFCPEVLANYRIHSRSISYNEISEGVGREYIQMLDNYFKSTSIPLEIGARRSEAYGYAHLLIARNLLRAGKIVRGIQMYEEACRLHPPLRKVSVKLQILRNAISKKIRVAISAISSLISR